VIEGVDNCMIIIIVSVLTVFIDLVSQQVEPD